MSESPAGVAVVIPCFDLGRTLEEALDSVAAQTRPASEIVVVDDGSADPHTLAVLDRLDRPHTRVLRSEHRGVAAARNLGVAAVTAPYILFLDADDRLAPRHLERTAERLDREAGLSFVSCALEAFEGASYRWKPPALDLVGTLTRGSVHISSLFRRALWDAVGGFDAELPAYEDMDFWLRAIELGFRGEILDEALLFYRVRAGSRYREGLEPERYREAMARIYAKHEALLRSRGIDALRAKESFLVEILGHQDALRAERARLTAEIAAIQRPANAAETTARPGVGVILAYHRIADLQSDPHRLCVPPALFDEHMRFLREHCSPLPLDELRRRARDGTLPARAVAVSLDDGYLDALTQAAPILAAHGVPATFFVNTDRLAEPHETWQDEIERILLSGLLPHRVTLVVDEGKRTLDLGTPVEREAAMRTLHGSILPLTRSRRENLLDQLRRLADANGVDRSPRPERRLLTADEVRALAALPGVSIGSHSASHLRLPDQEPAVQLAEVDEAKRALEDLLGIPVPAFCYPFGAVDALAEEAVRRAGHTLAVSTERGVVSRASRDLCLPRLEIGAETRAALAERLARAFAEAPNAAEENARLAERERSRGASTLASRPRFLIVDPTSRCNARCVMCPVSFRAPGDLGVDLPDEDFDKLRPLLPVAAHVNLFATGEPTLSPQLDAILDAVGEARKARAQVWLSTNGKHLAPDLVDRLASAGVGLQFSVDGGTKEVFEAIRRGIRWDQLLASLELVRARRTAGSRIRTAFSTTLSKANLHDLSNIFALAARYGIDHVMFYDEDPESPARAALVLDASDRPLFEAQLPFIESTGVRYSNGLSFRGAAPPTATAVPLPPGGLNCAAPWNVFLLRADGGVRTCCTLRESMGDLRGRSFDEVWNGEAYVRLRRAFVEQRDIPAACHRCTDPLRTWGA